jgi:tetratricopeptide (TPR) repeat protein
VFSLQGNLAGALSYLQRAHDLFYAAGSRHGLARVLNNIGWFHALLGEPQQALAPCQQALALNEQIGDLRLNADTLASLGYAHHLLGQHRQAIDHLQRSTARYREIGDRRMLATTLERLGDAHHAAGDRDAACDAWHEALTVLDQLGVAGPGFPDADQINEKLHRLDAPDCLGRPMR